MEKEQYIPATLIECFELVREEVKPEDWEKLRGRPTGSFEGMEHSMGWGLYLRNRFLHPRHSPIRAKLEKIVISFDADTIGVWMFKWLWMYAKGHELKAIDLRTMMDERGIANIIRHSCGLCPIRELELSQIEDLLGKSTE